MESISPDSSGVQQVRKIRWSGGVSSSFYMRCQRIDHYAGGCIQICVSAALCASVGVSPLGILGLLSYIVFLDETSGPCRDFLNGPDLVVW
ncbi:hypothetical protein BDV25DRAFT_165376 [Aspergillus avenaceus]|uniref:Uncharacterized protein n=1 Tax=Aspergillus avenaceus TaxID=36643 RepID=A0A5N6TFG4_ASPAV|nr:hypothetical protein BDV25DRAFT_165376 [Aspergillus avenaceus]